MKLPKEPPLIKNEVERFDNLVNIMNKYRDNKEFTDLVKKYNEKYFYWEEILHRDVPKNILKEDIWAFMKFQRLRESKNINIGKYEFSFNLTNQHLKKLHEFDLNLGGNLTNEELIPSEDKDKFLISSIIEESINSSKLEGASTTIDVAKNMILNNKKPKDKSQRMILNNYLAMKEILRLKGEKLTPQILLNLHKIVTNNTLDTNEYEGKFRNSNEIKIVDKLSGEIFHTPPNSEELNHLISEFCDFYNNEQEYFIHPIVKANILHFLFGFIHPFYDGNGRCARCIFFLFLISKNYWLFEYLSISRIIIKSPSQYAKSFLYTELDDNDLTYFIEYKIKKIELAFTELKQYIHKKLNEKKNSTKFLKFEGITQRQAEILEIYENNKHKIFSVLEISKRFGITKQTARSDLQNLSRIGFLIEKKSGNKVLFLMNKDFNYQ
ncbi:MAG: Fic family protein [Candidatus Woesearchaeota archaeon]